jgi:hypothetical protein
MKKLLSLLTVASMASLSVAQSLPSAEIPILKISESTLKQEEARFSKSANALDASEWYNYANAFETNVAGQLTYSVRFLSFDTNASWIFHDGQKLSVFTQLVGQMFDPKDSTYLGVNSVYNNWTNAKIDSVAFTRFYIRNLDSTMVGGQMTEVVDTMILQYFNGTNTGISYAGVVVPTGINVLGYPSQAGFNAVTMQNSRALKTIKVPLRKADADSVTYAGAQTTFSGTFVDFPVDVNCNWVANNNRGNNFCYTVNFKQMVPVADGDTVLNIATGAAPTYKKNNVFGLRTGSASGIGQENSTISRYNNTVFTFSFLRNGVRSANGWQGYISGTAYASALQWFNFIKVSTTTLNTKSLNNVEGLTVYPNPANSNQDATIKFNAAAAGKALVKVTDLNGRVVSSKNIDMIAGLNNHNVAIQNLNSGVYFVTISGANANASTKIVITK